MDNLPMTDTNKRPKVSVLIPVYNTEKYIGQCLESVVSQTLDDIEIICVNDGSKDGSWEIVESFSAKDSRFKLVKLPQNEGLARARFHGINAATGEYVMFLDSDDFLQTNACEVAYAEICKRKCDVFHFNANIVVEGVVDPVALKDIANFVAPYKGKISGSDNIYEECYTKRTFSWNLWNKIYKLETVQKIVEFIPNVRCVVGEDMFIFCMITHFVNSYSGDKNIVLYNYRYGNGVSTKATVSYKDFANIAAKAVALQNMENFFKAQNRFEGTRKKFVTVAFDELIHGTIWNFMHNVSEDVAPKCFDLLTKLFDYDEFIKRLVTHNDLFRLSKCIAGSEFLKTDKEVKSVALFYHRYGNGGVERVMSCLIPKFLAMGYKVTLIIEKETKNDFVLPEGCAKVVIPNSINISREEYLEHHNALRKAIRDNQVDLLLYQASNSPHMLFDILAAKKENCYFVATTHDWITSTLMHDVKQFSWKPLVLRCTDCVQTITRVEEEVYADMGIKTRYIPNPLTFEHITPPPMYDGAPNILWVGRLDYVQKDPVAALWVIKEIRRFIPNATLTMVGKAESEATEKEFDNIIKSMYLEEGVIRVGFTKEPEKYYRQASALLMTSSYEVYPMVLGEAMSYGLPIVSYDMPYVEFFRGDAGVITVPPRNEYLAAHALIEVLTDEEMRKNMRQKSLEYICELEKRDIGAEWQDLIKGLETDTVLKIKPSENMRIFLDTLGWHNYVCAIPSYETTGLVRNLFRYFKKFGVMNTLRKIFRYIKHNGLKAAIKKGRYKLY